MKKNTRKAVKIITTLAICLVTLLLIAFIVWFYAYAFANIIEESLSRTIFIAVGLVFVYFLLRVAFARIKEIKGENEDDYRNY